MKIISTYKDYYDYLQGKYGVDPLLILDRREGAAKYGFVFKTTPISICFCGMRYYGVVTKFEPTKEERFYWGEQVKELGFYKHKDYGSDLFVYKDTKENRYTYTVKFPASPQPTTLNSKLNCPIIGLFGQQNEKRVGKGDMDDKTIKFPQLGSLGFARVVPPEDAWLSLTQWLSDAKTKAEKEVPIGDDATRIKSHGFDTKTSFRPKMKKR